MYQPDPSRNRSGSPEYEREVRIQHDTIHEAHLPASFGELREMAQGRIRTGSP